MTLFLGISFTIIIRFKALNIVIVVLKLTKIWHFDPILRNLLCLDQKQVTMETRNIKYDRIRRFPLICGNVTCFRFCYNLKVCEVLQLFYFLHFFTPPMT